MARGTSAVPETLGGAGLVLDPGDGPAGVRRGVGEVLDRPGADGRLVAAGRRRLADFDPDKARRQVLAHLEAVL